MRHFYPNLNIYLPFHCDDMDTLRYWLGCWLPPTEGLSVIVLLLDGSCCCAVIREGISTVSFFTAGSDMENLKRALAHVNTFAPTEVHLMRQFNDVADLMTFDLDL